MFVALRGELPPLVGVATSCRYSGLFPEELLLIDIIDRSPTLCSRQSHLINLKRLKFKTYNVSLTYNVSECKRISSSGYFKSYFKFDAATAR